MTGFAAHVRQRPRARRAVARAVAAVAMLSRLPRRCSPAAIILAGVQRDPAATSPPPARWRAAAATLALALLAASCAGRRPPAQAPAGAEPRAARPYLVAHAEIRTGARAFGQVIGGLSGLAYDPAADHFLAVADDPRKSPPTRLLRFRWQPPAAPEPLGWLTLTDGGEPLPPRGADLEGLALLPDGGLLVSSEGDVGAGIGPWVGRFDRDGELIERLPVPAHFTPGPESGPPVNAGFEALAVDAAAGVVVAGTEGELRQDARPGLPRLPRRSRLLIWDLAGFDASGDASGDAGGAPREWLYPLDEPHARSPLPGGLRVSGLVDLLPEEGGTLLALERSFVAGMGFSLRLHRLDLSGATEVTGKAPAPGGAFTGRKRLLADLGRLGVPLDNYEGMAWGPVGPDGARLLVVIADNNFSENQDTHLVALSWR